MLLDKKCVYLGISLFSAMILSATSAQEIKAATTTSSTATSTTTTSLTSTTPPASTTNVSNITQSPTVPAKITTTKATSSSVTTASTPATTKTVATTTPASSTPSETVTTKATTTTASTTITSPTSTASTPTATTPAPTTNPGTSETNDSYAIPSNIANDTVVTFTDPTLSYAVKDALHIPYNANLTVGNIRSYVGNYLQVSMDNYDINHPNGPTSTRSPNTNYIADTDSTPIESLNGMQYFQLLPSKAGLSLQVQLASDPSANTDLKPLEKINFAGLDIAGNFSDPSAKEIDPSEVANLNLSNSGTLDLEGSKDGQGITQAQLNELAPTINKYANNGQGFNMIEFDNSSISDFSPLKGTETGKSVMINAVSNTINDPNPVYAINGQPIAFTAPKLLDPSGKDITPLYNYSASTTSAFSKSGNLTSTGADNFVLNNPDPTAKVLSYGNYGYHNGFTRESMVRETLGNTYFQTATTVNQPLVWQEHPTVTINYVDASGKPIMSNGTNLTKTISGTTIGSEFDLTPDSQVTGYQLTSPAALLKGTYTQNPQTIQLTYNLLPKKENDSTTTTKPGQTTNPAGSSSKKPASNHADGREPVTAHDTSSNSDLSDIDIHNTTKSGLIITYETPVRLIDSNGKYLHLDSKPNTKWNYDKLVVINGKRYYRIAPDKYLVFDQATEFMPVAVKSKVYLTTKVVLYNSRGQKLRLSLPANTYWKTDGYIIINGIKMYRVATDEYVEAKLF